MAILESPAQALDPECTARSFRVIESDDAVSVFQYIDTATSRASIGSLSRKFEGQRVAIVGLGGTGSYVLDLVAKTPVAEIHLFDRDPFLQHNAFRAPGAASIEDLRRGEKKVAYFSRVYSKLHRGVIAHELHLDSDNAQVLTGMSFVFLCVDGGRSRAPLVERLEEWNLPFVDVGMGVNIVDERLIGVLRVTSRTASKNDHVKGRGRIPLDDVGAGGEYARNIQIADLNSLNAALAVIKWKKLMGFYLDLESEHHATYMIDGNALINEDHG